MTESENAKFGRSLRMKARSRATTYLRHKYPEYWARIKDIEYAKHPGVKRENIYQVAEQAMRKALREEYRFWYLMHLEALHNEHAYECSPSGGHHTGRHAKPIGDPRRG